MGVFQAGLQAAGAFISGQSAASADKYNAKVADVNSAIQNANATLAGQAGSEQAGMESLKTRAQIGSTVANTAAAGLDVHSGSPVAVQGSERELGELDALTVRSNATRAAYGYQVQAENDKNQAGLDRAEASNDLSSAYLNAGSTFLSSMSNSASNFAKYQMAGGFDSGISSPVSDSDGFGGK